MFLKHSVSDSPDGQVRQAYGAGRRPVLGLMHCVVSPRVASEEAPTGYLTKIAIYEQGMSVVVHVTVERLVIGHLSSYQ